MNNEVEVTVEEVEEMAVEAAEEQPVAAEKPRRVRNQTAHVPGPRRKRKFEERPGFDPKTGTWDGWDGSEDDTVAEAPAEAEVSAEEPVKGFEKPQTYGSFDG